MKKIYKNVIQVEVLSEKPVPDYMELEDVLSECTYGEYSGIRNYTVNNKVLTGKKAVKEIKNHGTDLEFFGLDEKGKEIE